MYFDPVGYMPGETVIMLSLDGLEFRKNYLVQSGTNSYYVIENPSGGVTDILYYDQEYDDPWLGVHVGQVDRLTFFGADTTRIRAVFVDCREGSSTLHKKIEVIFSPDPCVHLIIPSGVAHAFSGMQHVTVRVESLWFMPDGENQDYDMSNDSIAFHIDESRSWPTIKANTLPVPDAVLKYVVAEQRKAVESGTINSFTGRAYIDGQLYKIEG